MTIGNCQYDLERVTSPAPGQLVLVFQHSACGPATRWPLRVYTAHDGPRRFVNLHGIGTYNLQRVETARRGRDAGAGDAGLEASMPGQVRAVLVREGDAVTRGQPLVILEAMKMELKVQAPFAGRVRRILCQAGQVVERGQRLVEVEREA